MAALENPLISIIVNCFNGEKYLKEALQSVLKQTYKNWELIFWDNQSTDNSKKIFYEFDEKRFKYFSSEKHTTLYEARNNAINKSKGEIIAFLDTDDWWVEKKLEKQINYFEDEKVGLVHSNCYLYYQKSKKKKFFHKKVVNSGYITKDLFKKYNIGILTTLIRKSAYIEELGFNNKYNVIGDFDLFMRLSYKWKFISMIDCLAYFRIHGENFSFLNIEMQIKELEQWISDKSIVSNKSLKPYLYFINRRVNFLKTKKCIIDGQIIKALKNIAFYPMGFNKVKLILQIFLPRNFTKKLEFYQ